MPNLPGPPPPHVRQLLDALADPASCAAIDAAAWDLLVRTARSARLLGTLAVRLEDAGVIGRVPQPVAGHLRAAVAESLYLRQMSLRQIAVIAGTLRPVDLPIVALKGSAYILAGLPCAAGRLPRDVDLMVERHRLDDVERALLAAGWTFSKTEEYDQRYYREWSHELPPLRAPTLPLELDLHHSILPPIGRLKPDAARLVADAVPVAGTALRVLRPVDQVLHAAVHLFQDSDCVDKLRDLVDIDSLVRDFSTRLGGQFWDDLLASAAAHGLGRPLWYALAFGRAWMATPVPDAAWEAARPFGPPAPARRLMLAMTSRTLGPIHPDAEPSVSYRTLAAGLEFRALWLRMPPWTLAYHAASKARRSLNRAAPPSSAPGSARG